MQTNESKWPKKLLIGLLIGFLCFVFIVTAAPLLGLWISVRQERARRPPQVKVPNVVGQDYRTAEAVLKEKGLGMRVLARRWDENQPVDIVLDQNPFGGESVDVGYPVGVTIGALPPKATHPTLK